MLPAFTFFLLLSQPFFPISSHSLGTQHGAEATPWLGGEVHVLPAEGLEARYAGP